MCFKPVVVISSLLVGCQLIACGEETCAPFNGPGGVMDTPWPMYRHDVRRTSSSPHVVAPISGVAWVSDALPRAPVFGSDGTLYASSSLGTLVALAPDGSLLWEHETHYEILGSATLGPDGTLYVGGADYDGARYDSRGMIGALAADGTVRWEHQTSDPGGASSAAIGPRGTVYFVDGSAAELWAIQPSGCVEWVVDLDGYSASRPAIDDAGNLYLTSREDQSSHLYCIRPDGAVSWRFTVSGTVFSGPALAADDTAIFATDAGVVHAVDGQGLPRWEHETGMSIVQGVSIADDDSVFVAGLEGSEASLFALTGSGALRWTADLPGNPGCPPLVDAQGTVILGTITSSTAGTVVAFSTGGTFAWDYAVSEDAVAQLAIGGGGALFGAGYSTGQIFSFY
jgi:sugar lactone lactonase YvrE